MSTHSTQAEISFFEGTRRMQAGDSEGAEKCFRQALSRNPDFPEALANLGLLLDQGGKAAEAETAYRRSLALDPRNVQAHLNLGVMLTNLKRFADAEETYRRALTRAPDSPVAWSNYGVLLACLKREDEAESAYRTALGLDDGYAKARFNLAYLLLRQGRFDEGWACLEARDWYAWMEARFAFPRWRGETLAGKSLLIGIEAGHGDMIQFCRYAGILKARGARRIAVVCHPGLKALFATLSGVDEVFAFDEDWPDSGWDFWTPPLSLPFYCQTRLESIPASIPYLAADPQRLARWLPRLPAARPRIGLVWKGNPRFENDADRSLPSLETLAPLWAVDGLSFVSLQKGPGEEEARNPPLGQSLLPLGERFMDFADTAAVISGLDLVISVDTAVAHLAGAMGKPCWVLLPDYRTDWRWLTDREDSPWYPGAARLFRQPAGGGWGAVVQSVAQALRRWIFTVAD